MKFKIKFCIALLVAASLSLFVIFPHGRVEYTKADATLPGDACICSVHQDNEEVKISSRLYELLFGKNEENETVLLIPGGGIFGAKIKQSFVSVQNPGECRELRVGDKITSIAGTAVSSLEDVKSVLHKLGKEEITIFAERDGKKMTLKITPKEVDGEYKLGLVLKDGAAGIGTITYIDPKTGEFGGLGHGICDTDTGKVIEFTAGKVTGVVLGGVKKGEEGKPGELSGLLTDKVFGELHANTECGVFGKLDSVPKSINAEPMEIAHRSEVHEGEATIISSVKTGAPREFKIRISDVNKASTGTKSFKITVTDPTLISITGGVVRGMSGSPIIQDGKLVGAVTHVLVANPTEGYGIFIENMLNAAENTVPKAA